MVNQNKLDKIPQKSSPGQVTAFLDKARALQIKPDSRLIFALDATASRQPTWDRACHLQARMFDTTRDIAGLSIQLCYYRGLNEFHALPWSGDGVSLQGQMLAVSCLGGYTQIGRILRHALEQHRESAVKAAVFIGDAVEEDAAALYRIAGQLRILGLPVFMFQEGSDPATGRVFAEIARLSGGVHCQFNENSEDQLHDLLTAVAMYASGGVDAVKQLQRPSPLVRQLIQHLPGR